MAEIIKMPKLSDTMEEGVVAKWHKKVGDKIDEGELLADIETDKATMEFESFYTGTVLHRGVGEGETAPVDTLLVIIGEEDEDISALLENAKSSASSSGDSKSENTETSSEKEPKVQKEKNTSTVEKIDTSSIKANIITMPKLSDTMNEGTVASWAKEEGDKVESGELLAEIETDKATMEFESFEDGYLLYKAVAEGESAAVDSILAIVGEKDADFKKLIQAFEQEQASTETEDKKAESTENEAASKTEKSTVIAEHRKQSAQAADGRVRISPLAKKMAEDKGYDISQMKGSGDGGRIVKRDVEEFKPKQVSAAVEVSEAYEDRPVSQMRKVIGKRLSESKFVAPHFYLTIDLDMDKAIESRKAINDLPDTRISFNDLVIKGVAAALKKHPAVNAAWLEDKIRYFEHVHIGVAVAVDEGLLVPVVRHADRKQLSNIAAEVKDYAQRAKDKKLQPEDWEGSTFSISNLGMFGIEEFTAIINPPNACILAVEAIRQEPVVKEGEIVVGNRMKVTLSCDHRVVDGATGAEFLKTLRAYLENPVTMLG